MREDFADAARLRLEIPRYDAAADPEWHSLLEDSAALTAGVQEQLQQPARRALDGGAAGRRRCRGGRADPAHQRGRGARLLLLVSVLLT